MGGPNEEPVTRVGVAVRWILGLFCVAIEISVAASVIAAVRDQFEPDDLLFWHPTIMTIGTVLFLSHGLRTYTAYTGLNRNFLRFIHGLLNAGWLIFGIVGLALIVQLKRDKGYPQFESVHSRLGIAALFFSVIQGIAGTLKMFVVFATNKKFLRWHGRLGPVVYAIAIAAFLAGVTTLVEPANQDTAIATYVLMAVVAAISLFLDFFSKGFDLVPTSPPGEDHYLLVNQQGRSYDA